MTRLVLFDIDGTLMGGRMGSLALKTTFEQVFDVEAHDNPELQKVTFNGRSDHAILADMAEALGIPQGDFKARQDRFLSRYFDNLHHTVQTVPDKRVLPGVYASVKRLHEDERAELGLLTGNLERGARIKLRDVELSDFFPFGGFG